MKYAVNSKEAKLIDSYTINELKIPDAVLMERAAYETAAVMKKSITKDDHILTVCGPGNNGGDGIAAGRILYLQGYHVAILFVGDENKASAGLKAQMEIAVNLGIPLENCNKLPEYNIIIDAIFGVGLSRPVIGEFEEIINKINEEDSTVFSVDIPSGISSDNGQVLNTAVRADHTITFGHQKLGLLLYPGAEYAGQITVADIGFPGIATEHANPGTFYYEKEDLKRLPARNNYSNKGTFGKVLIIAGSKGMSGAACLSAKAAYRTGAGLVKVLTSKENRIIVQTSLPEALFAAYDDCCDESENDQRILSDLTWADVIVIGPGLGLSRNAEKLLDIVIKNVKVPVVIDADGINLLAGMLDQTDLLKQSNNPRESVTISETIRHRLDQLSSILGEQTILTPHLMELSRLLRVPVSDIVNNLVDTAIQCSYNKKLIYAIKDARSIVVSNERKYINVSGNNGMATGGSGDVLTGIIAALTAQGMMPYEAACLAVYIHGLAGDEAALEKGPYSMMAGDIVNCIDKVVQMTNSFSK